MTRNFLASLLVLAFVRVAATAKEPARMPPQDFAKLHAMFKSQPGESRFWELPWMIQLDRALRKGAAEGKPVFVWCGAGGAPVGVC